MSPRSTARLITITTTVSAAAFVLSGCVPNSTGGAGATALDVKSSATECTVSAASAPSGSIVFSVTNTGDQETEFYLLGEDGKRVVGEVEHIGPGTSRDLAVDITAGQYFTVCKPGMSGDGIGRTAFTVTK